MGECCAGPLVTLLFKLCSRGWDIQKVQRKISPFPHNLTALAYYLWIWFKLLFFLRLQNFLLVHTGHRMVYCNDSQWRMIFAFPHSLRGHLTMLGGIFYFILNVHKWRECFWHLVGIGSRMLLEVLQCTEQPPSTAENCWTRKGAECWGRGTRVQWGQLTSLLSCTMWILCNNVYPLQAGNLHRNSNFCLIFFIPGSLL